MKIYYSKKIIFYILIIIISLIFIGLVGAIIRLINIPAVLITLLLIGGLSYSKKIDWLQNSLQSILKIKNEKVLITGNRIYLLDINTFGLEAEVGGFINATDCDLVSFNRLFVTDRGDGYVKVVDLDNLHINRRAL